MRRHGHPCMILPWSPTNPIALNGQHLWGEVGGAWRKHSMMRRGSIHFNTWDTFLERSLVREEEEESSFGLCIGAAVERAVFVVYLSILGAVFLAWELGVVAVIGAVLAVILERGQPCSFFSIGSPSIVASGLFPATTGRPSLRPVVSSPIYGATRLGPLLPRYLRSSAEPSRLNGDRAASPRPFAPSLWLSGRPRPLSSLRLLLEPLEPPLGHPPFSKISCVAWRGRSTPPGSPRPAQARAAAEKPRWYLFGIWNEYFLICNGFRLRSLSSLRSRILDVSSYNPYTIWGGGPNATSLGFGYDGGAIATPLCLCQIAWGFSSCSLYSEVLPMGMLRLLGVATYGHGGDYAFRPLDSVTLLHCHLLSVYELFCGVRPWWWCRGRLHLVYVEVWAAFFNS
eukprot:Gb_02827 [translate_table: standard]